MMLKIVLCMFGLVVFLSVAAMAVADSPATRPAVLAAWPERKDLVAQFLMAWVGLVDLPQDARRIERSDLNPEVLARFRHFVAMIIQEELQPTEEQWLELQGWQDCELGYDATADLLQLDYSVKDRRVQLRDDGSELSVTISPVPATQPLDDVQAAAKWMKAVVPSVLKIPSDVKDYNCYLERTGKLYHGNFSQHERDFNPVVKAWATNTSKYELQWWEVMGFATDGATLHLRVPESDGIIMLTSRSGFLRRRLHRE